MSETPVRSEEPDRSIRKVRLGVLGLLGVCALAIASGAGTPPPDVAPPGTYSGAAIGLAVASIATRLWASGPRKSARLQGPLIIASLALAGTIGLVALLLALAEGQWRTALFYTLAAALLSIRPPSPVGPSSGDR